MRLLVTGASGFVGSALVQRLLAEGHEVHAASRRSLSLPVDARLHHFAGLDLLADKEAWRPALSGVDVIVHAAARVHVMTDTAADPLTAFRAANVDATMRLARLAVAAGVRRFVLVSSIKVNGEGTPFDRPYDEHSQPSPKDPCGLSKWEAEQALRTLAVETGLELVVIRPTLVYGPGAKGNLAMLMALLRKGLPLPLASIRNRRSMVGLTNLCHLLCCSATHPDAPGHCFLAADLHESTPGLIRMLARAGAGPARLLPFPVSLLVLLARLLRREAWAERLCGSLVVVPDLAKRVLGWSPVLSPEAEMGRMVAAAGSDI